MLWEDLTAADFAKGVRKSKGVCVVPLGVIEKHGEHLPLGTDMLTIRHVAAEAAKVEPAIVFPYYFLGQINEGKHQPGTIAPSGRLLMDALLEMCSEISRNGLKKIVLLNGHGGNNNWLQYFCQLALEKERDYSLYLPQGAFAPKLTPAERKMFKDKNEMHAGEGETSSILAIRPDTVKLNRDIPSRGKPLKTLTNLRGVFSGLWWVAQYPHHYAGTARLGSRRKGEVLMKGMARSVAEAFRIVKRDRDSERVRRMFYAKARRPRTSW